ncbi:hypothetical protein BCR43DRAFT_485429 [Syncephalastrum racemosum]|uniref:Vacuolar protein sorting-associated protein 27 n=1 Tax=Syncephalastrum racemosum TaxID=13706 RepID=A0A1X2HNV8_SYNRA|nr:hypothetical protein BCR43DRAFT_485429 [Syncephalastrum racemosum]
MVSLWWGQSALDELIEKATSENLPAGHEDLALNLEISDQIRSKKVNAKDAMRSLKRRLEHKNPNAVNATLTLTDTLVKNGGDQFVREVATREFMEQLTMMVRVPPGGNLAIRMRILSMIQTWALGVKGKPGMSYIVETYYLLQAEKYEFPPVENSSILLETSAPPEWSDSDVCERCRTAFTMTNRKHHCRQCGGTFCQQCSAKTMALPHLGIDEEVRVCDGCYIKLKLAKASKKDGLPPLPNTFGPSSSAKTPVQSTPAPPAPADDFDEDMKKAIEMSLKEEEQRKSGFGAGYTPAAARSSPQQQQEQQRQDISSVAPQAGAEEDDPDLAAAIAASLQDMNISSSAAHAGASGALQLSDQPLTENEIARVDMENIELFSTLIERIYGRGGDISNDPQINKLYTQIGALQPKLVKTLGDVTWKHRVLVEMHEKINAAVRTYDQLLEQRLAGAQGRSQYTPYGMYHTGIPNAPAATPSVTHAQAHPYQSTQDYPPVSAPMYPPFSSAPEMTPGAYAPTANGYGGSSPYPVQQQPPQQQQHYPYPYPSQAHQSTPQQGYHHQQQQQQQQPQPQPQPAPQQQANLDEPLIDLS